MSLRLALYFDKFGWTRESVQQAIWDRAVIPVRDRRIYPVAVAADPEQWEIDPAWDDPKPVISPFDAPTDIQIVVAGQSTQVMSPGAWKIVGAIAVVVAIAVGVWG